MTTQQQMLNVLNALLQDEPEAIAELIEMRVPVGAVFLVNDDNSVVVQVDTDGLNSQFGLLGVLNDILGPDARIGAYFDDDGQLTHFGAVP